MDLTEALKRVEAQVDDAALIEAVLGLCNLYSPPGQELASCDWTHRWMGEHGFRPRKHGIIPERYNVVGRLPGVGGGKSLLFSSHLDQAGPKDEVGDEWRFNEASMALRHYREAWLDGEIVRGEGVQNDKGPLVCFLFAAKAIRDAGIRLGGDVWLTACPGEMGQEPVDEFTGPFMMSKEMGAEYLMTHGGVIADYGIAAEGTDFGVSWVEAGKAFFKITVHGQMNYTPFVQHPADVGEHPSPILRTSRLLEALLEWSRDYEVRHRYESEGGTIIPKVQVGAIRGGHPSYIIGGTQKCALYLDCRLTPVMKPGPIAEELRAICARLKLEAEVELFLWRPSYEPDPAEVRPFLEHLRAGHQAAFDRELEMAAPAFSSMWRDHMVFNKFGVPSVTYGPTRFAPSRQDLLDCVKAYAAAALATCGIAEG